MINVVCAKRDIRPGSVITLDVVDEEVFASAPAGCVHSLNDVLGKAAKQLIPKGNILKSTDLEDSQFPPTETRAPLFT